MSEGGGKMGKIVADTINKQIEDIRISSCSDFAALALPNDFGLLFHWHYASGNVNERYKRIVVRQGKGLPGMALMIGRVITMDEYPISREGLKIECAVMLAENLKSAVAVPIRTAFRNLGLFLVGNRRAHVYSADELAYLQTSGEEFSALTSPKLGS
jgi:nitrogen regulatory protein A